MKLLHKFFFTLATVLVLAFTSTDAFSQCAMCQATVESNAGKGHEEGDNQVGTGLNTGILYLMLVPYVLIGTIGFLWYRSNRKKQA